MYEAIFFNKSKILKHFMVTRCINITRLLHIPVYHLIYAKKMRKDIAQIKWPSPPSLPLFLNFVMLSSFFLNVYWTTGIVVFSNIPAESILTEPMSCCTLSWRLPFIKLKTFLICISGDLKLYVDCGVVVTIHNLAVDKQLKLS